MSRLRHILAEEGLLKKAGNQGYWDTLLKMVPSLKRTRKKGNEVEAYIGKYKDATVRLARLHNFLIVSMAWGDASFTPYPVASGGVVEASGGWEDSPDQWRIGGVLPGSRRNAGFDDRKTLGPSQLLRGMYKYKSRVGPQGEPSSPAVMDVAGKFLKALRAVPAPEPWMKFKRVKLEGGNTITVQHGFIPRELRHPDETDYLDEYEIPGWDAYEAWDNATGDVIDRFSRQYPDFEFWTTSTV